MTSPFHADAVLAVTAEIEAIHAAIELSPATTRHLDRQLPKLWKARERAKPSTMEGAAVLLLEADDYVPELQLVRPLPGVYIMPAFGSLRSLAARVRSACYSTDDAKMLDWFVKGVRAHLGARHPMARMLANVAAFLPAAA